MPFPGSLKYCFKSNSCLVEGIVATQDQPKSLKFIKTVFAIFRYFQKAGSEND